MQLHNQGNQFTEKSIQDIINSFKSLEEQYTTEFNEAKAMYEKSGSTLIANQAMISSLSLGLDFILKGEQMITETHRQLANSLGRVSKYKECYNII